MITLDYFKLIELGEYISSFLQKNGLTKTNQLIINVDKNELNKIDEDIYYRLNPEGKDYQQADNEINLMFDKLNIIIKCQEK